MAFPFGTGSPIIPAMDPITVTRISGNMGRMRAMTVTVDGAKIAKLKHGQSCPLPAGAQSLRVNMDWARSAPIDLSAVAPGSQVQIRLPFPLNPLKWFGITGLKTEVTIVPPP